MHMIIIGIYKTNQDQIKIKNNKFETFIINKDKIRYCFFFVYSFLNQIFSGFENIS